MQNNILDVCDFKIQSCDSIKIKENFQEVQKDLLSQNFKNLKNTGILNKNFLYLFLSLDKNYSFIDNIYKLNDDFNFQVQNINNEFKIEYNESIKIFVDYKNKIINFLLLNENGRAKIHGKNIKNWSFNLDGEKYLINNKDITHSKSFNMLTGCVTFLDVNIFSSSICLGKGN